MKIISWNINGIRSACKDTGLSEISKLKPDLICLQEIKATENQIKELNLFKGYHLLVNQASKPGYSGVAVFAKRMPIKIIKTLGHQRFDQEGRLLLLDFGEYKVANFYIPHGGRQKENLKYKLDVYKKLLEFIKDDRLIIVGDFNIAHTEDDLARPRQNRNNIMFTDEERSQLDNIIKLGFIDGLRQFNKGNGFYTWWPYRADCRSRNLGWRIDYTFASKDIQTKIYGSKLLPSCLGSDHCPTMLEIDL